ncbi:hypothetical protein FDUTEX481_05823 [Tolypothrix sp. PCC 7601]|nr:hypothetical protein FDUTEX481_05823 [Tolypothrix sp. PCC 7601]
MLQHSKHHRHWVWGKGKRVRVQGIFLPLSPSAFSPLTQYGSVQKIN